MTLAIFGYLDIPILCYTVLLNNFCQ